MRTLLLCLLIACGSAPEPATSAEKPTTAEPSAAKQLAAEYAALHADIAAHIKATEDLVATEKATKSDEERAKASLALDALTPLGPPLLAKLDAIVKRAKALPAAEMESLLGDAGVDDVLLKGAVMEQDDLKQKLRQSQAEVDARAQPDKLEQERAAAMAKLAALRREKAELDRKAQEAKDAAAKAKQKK